MSPRATDPKSPDGSGQQPGSWGSTSPLGLEADGIGHVPPEQEQPAARAADLDQAADYEVPSRELIDWTPDRTQTAIQAVGQVLHTLDPVAGGDAPPASDLWKLTEQDAAEMSKPLARILNRYAPTRAAAGKSDEISLGLVVLGYVQRNLRDRGRVVSARKAEQTRETGAGPFEGAELEVEPHAPTYLA